MRVATAYLSFSLARAERLGLREGKTPTADRRELADRASGIHGDEVAALAYARREGPMLVVTPEGQVLRVEGQRDPVADARAAAEERAYAERRRWQPAERWQVAPRLRIY